MAEPPRPPVAVRIVRPFETEEAFLENELETVGKTSIILIGAHSRPTGVILRFEVTLSNGAIILRGEGRVLAFKETAFRGQPGLALRFTRLDPKSKAFIDRAAAIRDARLAGDQARVAVPAPSSQSAPPSGPPPVAVRPSPETAAAPDSVMAQILTSPTPPAPSVAPRGRRSGPPKQATSAPPPASTHDDNASRQVAAEATVSSPESLPAPSAPSANGEHASDDAAAASTSASVSPVAHDSSTTMTPDDRESILARLRERAASLTPDEKASLVRAPR